MMRDQIRNFASQFRFEPEVRNAEKLGTYAWYIVAGMGGSQLAAGLLGCARRGFPLIQHRDYGLPAFPPEEEYARTLFIASSYSGNTEETLDAFRRAGEKGIPRAAVSVGGMLLKLAREGRAPYVQMPDTGIQPRMGLGLSIRALMALMGDAGGLEESARLADFLHPEVYEDEGKSLAARLKGFVPVIYSSLRNAPLSYTWKIDFNETGKIPAFSNVFPELNHNEMTGFDAKDSSRELSSRHAFIFLRDPGDHPKILKRMEILATLYRERRFPVDILDLRGRNAFEKIFGTLILAAWTAYYTAEEYRLESEKVPMVEEFKHLLGNR